MKINRLNLVWILRICWALVPAGAGPLIVSAVSQDNSGFSAAFSNTATAGLWALWGAGAVCCLFAHSISLALVRWLAPLGLGVSCWAASQTGSLAESTVAISIMVLIQVLAFSAITGNSFVNAEAYGAEKRMLLRAPLFLQLFLAPLVWAVSAAGFLTGPLLLASQKWLWGTILTPLGLIIFFFGARSLYSLVRRQLIFVPNGIVLIDPLNLDFPLRIEKSQIKDSRLPNSSLGEHSKISGVKDEASSDSGILDLSPGTPGIALEIELNSPINIHGKASYKKIRITPTLPGAAMASLKIH